LTASATAETQNTNETRETSAFTHRLRPRPGKTFCDQVNIHNRAEALALLRTGLERGMFSAQDRDGWPQNVWAVTDTGEPLEAQLEGNGVYYGYPMAEADPFREKVLERWSTA
jgi:hypothetical protein